MTIHADWLSLIEVSGAFLAEPVLDLAFPQGLEGFPTHKRQTFRQTYEEWREAQDSQDELKDQLHIEWINWVLRVGLEWDEDGSEEDFKSAIHLPDELSLSLPEHGLVIKPDYALYGDNPSKPMLIVNTYSASINLNQTLVGDGWSTTPAERMSQLCKATGVRLGLVTNGEQWMLVDAKEGSITSYATWYARLWSQEPATLKSFYSLLNISSFFNGLGPEASKLSDLLDESIKHQDEVTETLGLQVQRAVEVLIQSLDRINNDKNGKLLEGVEPSELYEAGLTYMMRLVFLLCAEERGLLLLGDEKYESNYAVSTLRMKLREEAGQHGDEVLSFRYNAWSRLLALFRAVYGGIEHEELRMPALGGSLFDPDRYPFLEGRQKGTDWRIDQAQPLPIDNRTVLLFLENIQIYQGRTLSYRALDVEQIGYVYEGLLEKTVIRTQDVTLELRGNKSAKKPWVLLGKLASAELEGEEKVHALLAERMGSNERTIANQLAKEVDAHHAEKLLVACEGDAQLRDRLKPYFHLLRSDDWDNPIVYRKGAFSVGAGQDRRDSGSHYTPKLLTEAIVKETLEPLVYEGPSVGAPRENWRLKSSEELLNLKVCEPAMGSGSFLVQVCRWLGDRVVEAWQQEEANNSIIDVDGNLHPTGAAVELLPKDSEERVIIARRLVAERCVYGIDINPLAVELAKLSIWLVTLAKDKPFGFLDHNLRWGDCLLGIHSLDQLTELHPDPAKGKAVHSGLFDYRSKVKTAVDKGLEARRRIRTYRVRDIGDIQEMSRLYETVQLDLATCHTIADALIGEALANPDRLDRNLVAVAAEASDALGADQKAINTLTFKARQALSVDRAANQPRSPFHWPLEYPEVFEAGGFDAIVGNPPYLGGRRITGALGTIYRDYLINKIAGGVRGSADLVAYFFLHCYSLLKEGGLYGLLGVNTIAEGDTRAVGLEQLLGNRNATIFSAYPNEAWPGSAAVVTSRVHLIKGRWQGVVTLNGRAVNYVSAFLSDQEEWTPEKLKANEGKSFQGSIILGLGFTLSEEDAQAMIVRDPKNTEVLYPYMNGKDLNTHPAQKASRWVINFFDWPEERAKLYPEPFQWIKRKVYPERLEKSREKSYKNIMSKWWLHWNDRPALYHSIGRGDLFESHPAGWVAFDKPQSVLLKVLTSKHHAFVFHVNDTVFDQTNIVFALQGTDQFGILQSTIHEIWALKNGASMETRPRYTPSDVFETFPFPSQSTQTVLRSLGEAYHQARAKALTERNIGLTKFYNLFHNPKCFDDDVTEIRELRVKIDQAVTAAYGWDDLDLDHDFCEVDYLPENDRVRYTVSREVRIEILKRLSALNKERYQEEVKAGLHKKGKAKPKSAPKNKSIDKPTKPKPAADTAPLMKVAEPAPQYDMFGEEQPPSPAPTGNQWGSNAVDQILAWLEDKGGWFSKVAILQGCGANSDDWDNAITELLEDGFVKKQMLDDVERFRAND